MPLSGRGVALGDPRDAKVRLERAFTNYERFHAELLAWFDTEPYPHETRQEVDARDQAVVYAVVNKEPPAEWGLLVGDVINDLRFTLDYLAYQLVIVHSGKNPPPNSRGISFPIHLREHGPRGYFEYEKDGKILKPYSGAAKAQRFPSSAAAFVESVQPYNTGDEDSWLWILSEMCNINKHRVIHTIGTTLHSRAIHLHSTDPGVSINDLIEPTVSALEDGAVLATFRIVGGEVGAKINIQASIETAVAFEDSLPTKRTPADVALYEMCALTGVIYAALAPIITA